MTAPLSPRFQHPTYLIRRKFFQIFGASFEIFDPAGELAFFSQQRAFKLKEDIRIFADREQREEVLRIQARSWLDFSAAYDVIDSASGEKVGALRRKGFKSMVKDEWTLLDVLDQEIGLVQEESLVLAMIRRFVPYGNLVPQKFQGLLGGHEVCEFRQHFNPFIQKITLDFTLDSGQLLDRRLGLAAAILLSAIEERQD